MPYAVSVSASAHMESLLCVYTITIFCRLPHAVSACRIRTYGILARVQNQTGPHPDKWDKTGRIVEVRQHDQYAIKIDGSGRITLRNRKFLRKFIPVYYDRPTRSIYDDLVTRVTGQTPLVTPQLPDEGDPATPATTVTSARTPQRETTPDAVTPTTPGRDTPRRPILQTPRPARNGVARIFVWGGGSTRYIFRHLRKPTRFSRGGGGSRKCSGRCR